MTFPVAPDVTTKPNYSLGPVKPWVEAAAYYLGQKYNVKTIGGVRSDPLPDHPSGHALDFMVDIPTGNALAEDAIANYQALGIKYIIHNRQVWNPRQGWHPYISPSSIAYNPHTDHVHITFNDSPGSAFTNGTLNGSAFVAPTANGGNALNVQTVSQDWSKCAWHVNLGWAGGESCIISKSAARGVLGGLYLVTGLTIGVVAAIILVWAAKETEPGNAVSKSVKAVVVTAGMVVK